MGTPKIQAVAFNCFDTLLRITAPTNPWRSLLAEASRTPGAQRLDPRREPIATIEEFAEACGVAFRSEWRADLDREIASIEPMTDTLAVLSTLRAAGFRLALASNLAPAYVEPALELLRDFIDTACLSCAPEIRAVKPEPAFYSALQRKIGLPAVEILMVGDSLVSDVQGARAAGMSALHLVPGATAPGPGQVRCLADVPKLLGPN
ncbi:HAD family hydrolase [Paracoccus limosus]|nr:HAD family hydrolase [Paracoccus limosus]